MHEVWLVTMNVWEENYNVYFTEKRAKRAVEIMRHRLGRDAEHFDPHVIGPITEGEAFGSDISVVDKRQYEEVFLCEAEDVEEDHEP